jgi:hypothetical protein
MTHGNGHPGRDRCGARTRAGGRCQRPAGWGTPTPGVGRCKLHAGSTPTHQAHAARVLTERAETAAMAELRHLGVAPMHNPLQALAELAAEARQWQTILRAQVAELASLAEQAPDGAERVRAVVALYERAMDRTAAFTAMLVRLNVDDRLLKLNTRIGEAQGERLAAAITGILEDLGHHDPRHNPAVAPVVVARLDQLLEAGDDGS